ncbi:hypothetical protein FisN_16Lh104 [Fistulifera solaris]|uniref:Calcineurin-like phosphoesterase domain-containing protein n=1 Tax=Fistulifera solaris TaxID=1519565 RepID=A0A1Z5KJ11_FISSO|nr:hypothetical protein FisN_16Lh104 [Fistulifera solaris]|eukprot:GAX26273.1 hypothetical protein FisN_16Lh104 [Fistulifera solaris]
MASKLKDTEMIEAVSSSVEFSFIEDDKNNEIPLDNRQKAITDDDESTTDKKQGTKRFFLMVALASTIVFAGSLLMAFLLMKNSPGSDVSSVAVTPESPPPKSNTQPTPTENGTNETDVDEYPVGVPAFLPSATPVQNTSAVVTLSPVVSPVLPSPVLIVSAPSASPLSMTPIVFYAFGDIPYSAAEAIGLEAMMDNVPLDADFLVHVGDIRLARDSAPCLRSEYESVRDLFLRSHAPVLLAMGDNEWNDCPNIDEGYDLWLQTFYNFEQEWANRPSLQRWTKYPEVFHFVMREVLFICLNLVGGLVHDVDEWSTRLEYQYNSTRDLILEYDAKYGDAAKVVIIGHCDPSVDHRAFFNPFSTFVNEELQNRIPIMYLNGDKHEWDLSYDYMGAPSLMRLMVVGSSKEGPIRIEINPQELSNDPRIAFGVLRDSYSFAR